MTKNKLENGLVESMEAALEFAKGTKSSRTRVVMLAPPAPRLSKKEIAFLRKIKLGMSQNTFASYLNVSHKTVKAWEQGIRQPDSTALRLLQLFSKEPKKMKTKILSYLEN